MCHTFQYCFNGEPASIAFFEGAGTNLGLNAGIVISTGNVEDIANSVDFFANGSNNSGGDTDLENLVGMTSFDAAVLEFDITVAQGGNLDFEYVFGSEEYPEFVGSSFNDVFAFFFSGPGIPTPQNIAMIPGLSDPVAINFVNDQMNAQFYVANGQNNGQHIAFDGFTTPLPAMFSATAAETYHIKNWGIGHF